jgi:PAS domain S-box-containing protein
MNKPSPNPENHDSPGRDPGLAVMPTALLDALPAHIALLDSDGTIRIVNEAWKRFGAENQLSSPHHGVGQNYLEVCRQAAGRGAEKAAAVFEGLQRVLHADCPEFHLEYPCHAGTTKRWFHLTITPLPVGRGRGALVVHTDISMRRQAEEQARRQRDFHMASSRIQGMIARGGDLQALYENACRIAVEQGGLRMAWVGLASADGQIRPAALWGHADGYVELLQINADPEPPGGRGPVGQAFRTGSHACCNDLEIDDGSVQTRTEALQRGYRSCAAFPLAPAGRVTGVLAVYSAVAHCFGDEELELLGLLAESLSHAIHSHALEQERLRSEQALRNSEASLAAAQQVGKVGSWQTDIASLAVSWSRETHRIFETDPGGFEPTHAAFLELVHPDDRQRVDQAFAESLGKHGVHTIEHRLLMPDGRIKFVEERWQTFFDAQGTPLRAIGTCQEITERKLAEEQIQRSEALLRAVTDGAPDAIFVKDLEGRYLLFNEGAAHLVGKPVAEVLGRDDTAIFEPAGAQLVRKNDQQVLSTGKTLTTEEILTASGITRTYLVTKSPHRDTEGHIIGLIGISRDITAQRQAEQALRASEGRLRAIVENEPECVKVMSPDGRLQDMNAAGLHMIEASSLDAVRNCRVESLVHPEDRASFNELHERNLAGYTGQLRFRIIGLRGTERWMETHATPLFDPKGSVQSVLSVTRDVTERRRAEEALRQSEENFRSLFAEAATGIAVTTLDGRFLRANPAHCRMLGYSEAELRQHRFIDFTHPEDRTRNLELYNQLIAGDLPSFILEKRYLRKDGSHVWARVSVSTRKDAHGRAEQVIAVTEDITELRQAAGELARHQALLRIAGIVGKLGGWSVSVPEMELTWSDQMAAIHDIEPGATPDLATAFGYYHPEDRERVRRVFLECVESGCPFEITARLVTAKGRHLWIRAIGEAVRDAGGSIVRVQGAFQDISDQKTAALEIQRLGQRLTTTLESMSDAFYILDRKWRFVFLNTQAERLLQRRREDLLGREVWVEFPEAVGRSFEREYRQAMTSGNSVTFEEFYPSLNTWFEVHAHPSEEGLAVYFRDVTERRRSEDALRESEERFREMAENIDEVFFNYDPVHNCLLYVSPAFERLWGRPLDDVLTDPTSYLNYVHPEDRHFAESAFQKQLAGHTTQETFRILHPDGSVHWVQELAVTVKDAEGSLERVVGTMRDITASKQAEERLREQATLLDKAQDAILVRDLEHRILFWNKSAERLYGWSAEEAIGQTSTALLYRDPAVFAAAHAAMIERGEWSGEIEQVTKDGRHLVVEGHWSLVRDDRGQPKSVLAINTDVTERKRIEQQFLRAQRMESIGTLAGGIAHDLNNVLAPILMSIELLKLDETRPDKLDILATVESSAQHGADMVRQVLSFARGVEGRQIRLQPAHLVREVAKIANETFLKSIRVVSRIAEDLWPIQGDPTQLHQVLLNLCVNARDAMPEGGSLTLSADNLELDAPYAASLGPDIRPGRHVRLRVEDTGSGMPPEVLERIFDPFFTTKEPGKGTGLGLSTAQAIVRSHGGLLRVQSEAGEGTRFDLYLPALEGGEAAPPPPARQLPRGRGQTVLVVDDENSVRQIASQTLKTFGYHVLLAADGAEATAIFAARHRDIDVVLTDMMMPVMDGAAAIQVLLRIAPGARIIASSGLHVEAMKARAERAGVRHFIPKPYTAETLLQALHEALADPAPPSAG